VPGDWVTIAVIAERGPIKYTKAPVGVEKDEEDAKRKKTWEGKGKKDKVGKAEEEGVGGGGKKYVTLKMIDFGARSQTSGGGGYGQIRGDAFLNLILFEADAFDLTAREGGRKRGEEKVYRGGSGGAFEKLMDVREGDVIALLNPRVLKPFQVGLLSVIRSLSSYICSHSAHQRVCSNSDSGSDPSVGIVDCHHRAIERSRDVFCSQGEREGVWSMVRQACCGRGKGREGECM